MLLPQVDADGNDIAGLRSPELAVPLATYMGWQLYRPELGRDDELVSLQGSFVPFPLDAAERQRTGDPRRAILERYSDRSGYLALVEQMTRLLIADGYLRGVAEEVPGVIALNMRAASACDIEFIARTFPFRQFPNEALARSIFMLAEGDEDTFAESQFHAGGRFPIALGVAEPDGLLGAAGGKGGSGAGAPFAGITGVIGPSSHQNL